nr:PREDICTED: phosphatidylinositol 4-phosphate 3-kinase C2 domain-containing subunit beta-like [Equus przewalskii]
MLTLQMIRIMSKIWVQEGLDMRMVIFRCFSTGRGRGMVEMIPNAETLRKIQVEHGVTGSFKDRPLADWLQKHNPGEEEYEKVGWGARSGLTLQLLRYRETCLCTARTAQLCWEE